MALNLTPLVWDWASVTVGDTFPAANVTETASVTAFVRVRIKIRNQDGVLKLTLDSATSGVTINTTTAGAWDFDIDEISPADTGSLTAGIHNYDLEITDDSGIVRTEFTGSWTLLPQIPN